MEREYLEYFHSKEKEKKLHEQFCRPIEKTYDGRVRNIIHIKDAQAKDASLGQSDSLRRRKSPIFLNVKGAYYQGHRVGLVDLRLNDDTCKGQRN